MRGSYLSRIASLDIYLDSNPLNLIVLTESHYDGKYPSAFRLSSLPNSLHQTGRSSRAGGISIFSSSPITNQSSYLKHQSDFLACNVSTPLGHRTILAVYHRPRGPEEQLLDRLLDNIASVLDHSPYPVIILGDFNLHHPQWNQHARPSATSSCFNEFLQRNNLHIINTRFDSSRNVPTHERGNVLDLIISNIPSDFASCSILDPVSLAIDTDHSMVCASFRSPPAPVYLRRREFRVSVLPDKWLVKKADWKLFAQACNSHVEDDITRACFNNVIHGHVHDQSSIESIWSIFSTIILQSAELAVPTTPRSNRYSSLWWKVDPLLPQLHKACTSAHQCYLNHRNTSRHEQCKSDYRQARYKFRTACRNAKKQSFSMLAATVQAADNNPNWSAFHRTIGLKQANLSCVKDHHGALPHNMAHSLDNVASFLKEVNTLNNVPPSPNDAKVNNYVNSPSPLSDSSNSSSRFNRDISFNEVRKICNKINLASAIGPDNISPHFLKHLPHSMLTLLWQIFNYSWTHSLLPQQWKQADVVLIPKKGGDPSDPKSFRPISLTSLVVKAFERIIYKRIIPIIDPLLNPMQSGFRRSHSTIDNLYHLTSVIHRRIWTKPSFTSYKNNSENHARNKRAARGRHSTFHCAFIDLSKAFDRAWHNGILYKLGLRFGITGRTWSWIRSFLSGRTFRVISGDIASLWKDIIAGVPQGSVLAPLLFLILINDIDESSYLLHFLLYADDIVAWPKNNDLPRARSSESHSLLVRGLNDLLVWCSTWKFIINGPKSGIMSFHRYPLNYVWPACKLIHPDDPSFITSINHVEKYSYLGLLLRYDLNWDDHAKEVLKKAHYSSCTIARIIGPTTPSFSVIRRLILSCVIPVISYGLPMWLPTPSLCKKFIPIIARPLFRALGIPWNTKHLAVLCYSAIPDFQSILHQQVIRVCNRLSRRPLHHHTRPIWNNEKDVCLHSIVNDLYDNNASPLSNLVSRSLAALSPASTSATSHRISNFSSSYKNYFSYYPPASLPPPAAPPKPRPLITRLAMNDQFHRWLSSDTARLLRSVHDLNSPFHNPSPALTFEDVSTSRIRSRFRFNRTSLNAVRARHSKQASLALQPCPLCNESLDTVEHYLLRCQHPTLLHARVSSLLQLHHPITRLSSLNDIPSNAIVVFLKHTVTGSFPSRRVGCAALINYPSSSILNSQSKRSTRLHHLSATGTLTDVITFDSVNSTRYHPFHGRWVKLGSKLISSSKKLSSNLPLLSASILAIDNITQFIGDHSQSNDYHPHSRLPVVFISEQAGFVNSVTGFNSLHIPSDIPFIDSFRSLLQGFTFHGQRSIFFLHHTDCTFTWLASIHSRQSAKAELVVHVSTPESIQSDISSLVSRLGQSHPSHSLNFLLNTSVNHILNPMIEFPLSSSISQYSVNQLLRSTGNLLASLAKVRPV
jgi:hypothetical protein